MLDHAYSGAMAITPHDTNLLSREIDGISVNVGGTLKMGFAGGDAVTLTATAGVIYRGLRVVQVYATGTAATGIIGYYR